MRHPAKARGSRACPWLQQGATVKTRAIPDFRFRGNDGEQSPLRPLRNLRVLYVQALLLFREEFADFGEQLARAEGLGDIAVAARLARFGLVAGERVRGNRDDRHLREL